MWGWFTWLRKSVRRSVSFFSSCEVVVGGAVLSLDEFFLLFWSGLYAVFLLVFGVLVFLKMVL